MNSVLNDLTYCDGRYENGIRTALSETPSRLKLRSNTFEGIQTNLEKRRTPIAKPNDFVIPSAAMPQALKKVEAEPIKNDASPKTNANILDLMTFKSLKEEKLSGKGNKKLKVGNAQITNIRAAGLKYNYSDAEVKTESSEIEIGKPVVSIKNEQPKIEEVKPTNIVELPKVEKNVQEKKEENSQQVQKPNANDKVISIDEVRRRAYNQSATPIPETATANGVETVFQDVENARRQWEDAKRQEEESIELKEKAESERATKEKEYKNVQEELREKEASRDDLLKQEEAANEEIEKTNNDIEKIRTQLRTRATRLISLANKAVENSKENKNAEEKAQQETAELTTKIQSTTTKVGEVEQMTTTIQSRVNEKNEKLASLVKYRSTLEKLNDELGNNLGEENNNSKNISDNKTELEDPVNHLRTLKKVA